MPMFALPLGYCENAPLDVMIRFYRSLVVGLVFKAYPDGRWRKCTFLPWLTPYPCLKGIGSHQS